jgi:disulfide bond formation protein DsbB
MRVSLHHASQRGPRRPDALAYDWRSKAFIALSVMGIGIAIYHAYGEITFSLNSCSLSAALSCKTVFSSGYTTFPPAGSIPGLSKGIDFWIYGVVWFPLCLAVGLWSLKKYGGPKASVVVPFLMVGNIFTLYPWDIEIRILGGVYCPVCVSMYFVNYILTFVALSYRPSEPE